MPPACLAPLHFVRRVRRQAGRPPLSQPFKPALCAPRRCDLAQVAVVRLRGPRGSLLRVPSAPTYLQGPGRLHQAESARIERASTRAGGPKPRPSRWTSARAISAGAKPPPHRTPPRSPPESPARDTNEALRSGRRRGALRRPVGPTSRAPEEGPLPDDASRASAPPLARRPAGELSTRAAGSPAAWAAQRCTARHATTARCGAPCAGWRGERIRATTYLLL